MRLTRRGKIGICIGAIAAIMVVVGLLMPRPKPVDLTSLAFLKPIRKESAGGWVSYEFKQPMAEVETFLDAQLTDAAGWEAGGGDSLGYVWYHRKGWRDKLRGLLADIGFKEPFVDAKRTTAGTTVVTIYNGGAILP